MHGLSLERIGLPQVRSCTVCMLSWPSHSVSRDPDVIADCPVVPVVDAMASKGELADWQRPPVLELQQIVDVLGSVMHEMLAGKRTPDDAVKESQQEIDRIMRKAGYY